MAKDRVTIYLRTGTARPPYRECKRFVSISRKLQDIRPDAFVMSKENSIMCDLFLRPIT